MECYMKIQHEISGASQFKRAGQTEKQSDCLQEQDPAVGRRGGVPDTVGSAFQ
jgi:hypothetical protein